MFQNEATQNDVSHDENALADPILQFVVVPALPRAARVEWHSVARLNSRHRTGAYFIFTRREHKSDC